MRKIEAIIKPFKLDEVREALNEIGVKIILDAFDKIRLQDYPNSKGMVFSGESW